MSDREDKAAKERMMKRRASTVTPTAELKKLAEILGEKPKETNDRTVSEFDLL